mgnify:CR=1 FL=1
MNINLNAITISLSSRVSINGESPGVYLYTELIEDIYVDINFIDEDGEPGEEIGKARLYYGHFGKMVNFGLNEFEFLDEVSADLAEFYHGIRLRYK